ncbi:MAG: TonB-dependent receptor [Nitrosomonas sp.]|nr:TonB-dependent receptor [Nitrosomonas sp.]
MRESATRYLLRLINGLLKTLSVLKCLSIPVIVLTGMINIAYAGTTLLDLPAAPLPLVLDKVAKTMEVKIDYDPELLSGRQSTVLKGNYEVKEALALLLEDKGLMAVETASGRYTVRMASKQEHTESNPIAATLPEIVVEDSTEPGSPYNKQYIRPNTSTATKTNTPVMQTPFSIQVLPRQVLQDRQSFRLQDALQNVSGVTFFPNSLAGQDAFTIRGFQTNAYYRNGVFIPDNNFVEMANVEQVEVLKGPGSILFGRADPGGIINNITKQPLATPYYSLQQQAGNFNFYRTAVDATGPLTKDGTLLYRMNLSYENSGSFRNAIERNTVFFAPTVTWKISPRTQITAEMEYSSFNLSQDGGIPALGNRPAPVSPRLRLDEPGFSQTKGDRYFGGVNWSHQINENWKLNHWLSTQQVDVQQNKGVVPFGAADPNGLVTRFAFDAPFSSTRYQSMLNLVGNVNTGIFKHTLLFGYDYYHQADLSPPGGVCCPESTINIFNPIYLTAPPIFDNPDFIAGKFRTTTAWHGAYFQDQVKLPFNLHAMGGFRYDNAVSRDTVNNETTGKDDRFSPRGGLLWQPLEWLSLYGSYTENFGVSNGIDVNRNKLPPQTAQQWEMGIKNEFWGGRLRSTFSYFELIKQGIAVPDPANPRFSKSIGEAETRGVELDVAGEILPGWNMIATYSYMPFAKITKDVSAVFDNDGNPIGTSSGNEGNRLFLAAEHTGSLWNTYEFRDEKLRGLRIGGGIQAIDKRQGDAENSLQLPAFVIGNLMASYQFKVGFMRMTAQLNVNNVSGEKYFTGTNGANYFITPGASRIFLGSLRIDY